MAHPRQQIRDSIKAILDGNTSVLSNVYTERVEAIFPEEYPLILIFADSETSEKRDETPRSLDRTLNVNIQIVGKDSGPSDPPVENQLDDIALEVENLMEIDRFLGLSFVNDSWLSESNLIEVDNGEKVHASLQLSYIVEYCSETLFNLSSPSVGDFIQANILTEQPPADVDTDAEDNAFPPQ